MTAEEYIGKAKKYIEKETRSIMITYTMYNIPSQYFTHVNMLLE